MSKGSFTFCGKMAEKVKLFLDAHAKGFTSLTSNQEKALISYDGLFRKLTDAGLTRTQLAHELGISSRTMAKIGRGEKVAARVLVRIATFFDCAPEELCRSISDKQLLQQLRDEKAARMPGGLYHELQVRMTYNSNHMEGSRLSQEQTRYIFETQSLVAEEGVPVDDVLETVNHFRCIDLVLDQAEEPLSESLIKQLHALLKQGTQDASLSWFAVGDYKKQPNMVGGRETARPEEVAARMAELLAHYEALDEPSFEDIVRFHYDFERIHPFQDGNGRVGRLIALKECLRQGITPFLIEDSKKFFYYRGLAEWKEEPGYLLDTCRDAQDSFTALMRALQ